MAIKTIEELMNEGWQLNDPGTVSVWKKDTSYALMCSGSTVTYLDVTTDAQALMCKLIMLAVLHGGDKVEDSEFQEVLSRVIPAF